MTKLNTTDGLYPAVKGKKRKMAELLCNPDEDLTVKEMCDRIGISRTTFYNWLHDGGFTGYVNFLIDSYTDSEVARVWKSLISRAVDGEVQAIKLFFEMKNMYKSKVDISGGVVILSGEEDVRE